MKGFLKMSKLRDLTGEVFGRLTVIKRADNVIAYNGVQEVMWHCVCSCGKSTISRGKTLKSGYAESCGCLRREITSKNTTTHGKTGLRYYRIWKGMKRRCDNKNDVSYPNYGGRGIKYEPKWSTFEGFWEDMEEGYENPLTLERLDVNGDYTKITASG